MPDPKDDPTTSVTTTLPPDIPVTHGDVLSALIQEETDFTSIVTALKAAKVQMDASVSKATEDTTAYNAVLAQAKSKLAEVRAAETAAALDA